ncbi:hypothetical protein ES703_20449 [subsurface metagenome]
MKKTVILVVVTLGLILGSIAGGLAYAQTDHQPPRGQKLIGLGIYGVSAEPTYVNEALTLAYYWNTAFDIINPNCDQSLTITYLAIIDEDGNVVAEGTPEQWNEPYIPEELGPHQIWHFGLNDFLAETGVIGETPPSYTIEISWTSLGGAAIGGARGGSAASHPLTGWAHGFMYIFTFVGDFDPAIPWEEQVDDVDLTAYECEMVNFQR